MRRRSSTTAACAISSRASSSSSVRSSRSRPDLLADPDRVAGEPWAPDQERGEEDVARARLVEVRRRGLHAGVLQEEPEDRPAAVVPVAHHPAGDDGAEHRRREDSQAVADGERRRRQHGGGRERPSEREPASGEQADVRDEQAEPEHRLRARDDREGELDHARDGDRDDEHVAAATLQEASGVHSADRNAVPRRARRAAVGTSSDLRLIRPRLSRGPTPPATASPGRGATPPGRARRCGGPAARGASPRGCGRRSGRSRSRGGRSRRGR